MSDREVKDTLWAEIPHFYTANSTKGLPVRDKTLKTLIQIQVSELSPPFNVGMIRNLFQTQPTLYGG